MTKLFAKLVVNYLHCFSFRHSTKFVTDIPLRVHANVAERKS